MVLRRARWAAHVTVLLVIVALIAGCAPQSRTPQGEPGVASTAAAPASPTSNEVGGSAASLDGAWEGKISVAGQELGIKLNLQGQGGTIDIPAQNVKGITVDNLAVQGDQVSFQMLPKPQTATYTGTVKGDTMSGEFEQAGYEGTWSAARQVATASPAPKSYKDEEVTFANGEYTLAGTLSIPQGSGPHPAVILISGSGAQNRDEEVFGFRPFAILADALANKGIAVLRYDDRGVGGSTMGGADDTSETFAGDVSAAFEYLKTRKEIDPKQIGLLGHSEGGVIAPMVAVEETDVAFVVLLAGTGVPGKDVLIEQAEAVLRASGADEGTVEHKMELQRRVIDAVVTGQGLDSLRADFVQEFKSAAEQMPEDQRKQLGDIDEWAEKNVTAQIAAMQGAWMQFFLTHDPAPVLEKVDAPVLALFGGKDVQVVAATNEPAMKAALVKGGNKDATTKVFPDANHLFQAAQTGGPEEYASLPPEFDPAVLDTITGWIAEHTK